MSGPRQGGGATDIFVQRPVLSAVISLLLLLLGLMGYRLLGVRETPDVESPVVSVSTSWPGADPAIMETDVTEVLERELNGIEGVRTMSSTSQDGRSEIRIEFELGLDIEAAANDVRGRVGQARRRLPTDVDEPIVSKSDASGDSVMFVRLSGEGFDLLDVTEVADTIVRERIENVPGVSGVDLNGARVWAMRLELDAARLAARRVTVGDIEAALRAGNVDVPAGRLEGAATQLTLSVQSGLRTPEEFGALIVRADGDGQVYLRDVASLRLGAENERTAARTEGAPTITLSVNPQAKANVVDVADEVKRRLSLIEADLPVGMTLDVVYDRAEAVRASIRDVEHTLLVAFGLVVAVIFLFLRDLRSTLVPTLAIPVSLVGTFLVLWIAGFTLNVFTLFGLVLAIGLVVDDAIVVLENIVRRLEEGDTPYEAALLGTRQIAAAVVATTLSLVVVFLPVVFTGGATGRLFLEFGVTVAASVALSMIVALTLTPMLCAKLLAAHARPVSAPGPEGSEVPPRPSARREPLWERTFNRTLAVVMRRPWLVLPMLVGAVAVGGYGLSTTPREFFPIEDRGMFQVRTEAPEGTTFEWMDARMREVEATLAPLVPERRMMLARVATGRGGVTGATNSGMIMFPLVPRDERDRSQQQIVDALRGPLGEITAFRAVPTQSPTVGRGSSSPLQFVLQHPDFETLAAALPEFVAALSDVPGLSSVNPDLKLNRPELRLVVDREKAAALGVPIRELVRTVQVLTGSAEVSTFKRGVRQYKVIAELGRGGRDQPGDLAGIHLRTASGDMVPLSNFVRWEEQSAPSTRYHYDRAPSATISANLDGITLGEAITRARVVAETLPEGFRTALAGQSKDFEEGSSSLLQMFLLALALVYLLLAAQFDSFVAPISILLSVPLALAGAFAALLVTGSTLSFFAQVGLILLVGLVTKNGILIVEYARQLRDHEGLLPWAAAEQATRLRVRPILMTSVATIGGAVPIALGMSGDSRAALGIAVVGGMISATVLTLYVTPVVYASLASLGRPRASGRARTRVG
ncbi:MAG: efflux RND transporter permease subunit [Pseudomonadota bacterium]|nr:efflux RND transporter permease subunit [Pseudomonadota bacterium]